MQDSIDDWGYMAGIKERVYTYGTLTIYCATGRDSSALDPASQGRLKHNGVHCKQMFLPVAYDFWLQERWRALSDNLSGTPGHGPCKRECLLQQYVVDWRF